MFICKENVNKPEVLKAVERLAQYSTPVLADAIAALKSAKNKVIGNRIRGVKPGLSFAGVAVTVKAPEGNLFAVQYALYKGFPGAVLCIDTGNHMAEPYLGEMMATTAQGFGYRAIVIDGLIRDVEEIRNMDYPVFAVGYHPRAKAPVLGGEVNTEIKLDGAVVCPGDIILGDDNGMVIIAPECAEELLVLAAQKCAGDDARLERIKSFFATPEAERDIYTTMGAGFAKLYKELDAKN